MNGKANLTVLDVRTLLAYVTLITRQVFPVAGVQAKRLIRLTACMR